MAATSFTVELATQITAVAPAQAAGPVDVLVTTSGGTSANTASDDFNYIAAPAAASVDSCSPTSVPRNGRLTVMIIGSGFQNGVSVDFGAMIRVQKVTLVNNSRLDVRIKVNKNAVPGPRDVTTSNPDGLSSTKVGCITVT